MRSKQTNNQNRTKLREEKNQESSESAPKQPYKNKQKHHSGAHALENNEILLCHSLPEQDAIVCWHFIVLHQFKANTQCQGFNSLKISNSA